MPRTDRSPWLFVGIGLAGGFFAALFGVGGGIIVVPLFILVAGLDAKHATATSLGAIGLTAVFGVASFASLGEVRWGHAVMVGLPALAGTFLGTALQRRISSRALVLAFAGFIVAIAVELFLE